MHRLSVDLQSNHLTEGVVPVLQDSSNHLLPSKSSAQQQSSHRGRCLCCRIPAIQDNHHSLIEGCLCYIIPILQDNNNHLIKRVVTCTYSSGQQQPPHKGGCLYYRIPVLQDGLNPVLQDNHPHLIDGSLCYRIVVPQDSTHSGSSGQYSAAFQFFRITTTT